MAHGHDRIELTLTGRERDTILAALRFWQRDGEGQDLCEIAENNHGQPLTSAEIDALIEERLNL